MTHWFANLKLVQKIAIPLIVLLAVIGGILWTAKVALSDLNASMHKITDVTAVRLEAALGMMAAVNEATVNEKNIILETAEATRRVYDDAYRKSVAAALQHADRSIAMADNPERRAVNQATKDAILDFDRINRRSIEHGLKNETEAAFKISSTEGRPARQKLVGMLQERVERNQRDLDEAKADAAALAASVERNLYVTAGVGLVAVFGLLGWIAVVMVARPLTRMAADMAVIAGGNLDIAVVGADRRDEVGSLARSLQVFKDNGLEMRRLHAAQERAKADAEAGRRALMNEMADHLDSTVNAVVTQVSAAVSQVQGNAHQMSAMAEQSKAQAMAVSAATQQAAANVQTVATAAEEMAGSIAEISRQVARSADVARRAVGCAEGANRSIQSLADQANAIGDVVKLITDIASQTNLLALNATIEAARAGEAGKGFAVVASEVKSLANQTAKATDDIASQIGSMQHATGATVQAIGEITATITEMDEIATTIASAMEEQDAATKEIARNVQQAAQGTEDVSTNIAGVEQAANGTGTAARGLMGAADSLVEQTSALTVEVDRVIRQVRAG